MRRGMASFWASRGRKPLQRRRNSPASGLARGLLSTRLLQVLTLTLSTLLISGCIVPQDDYVLEDLPLKKNRPVRIIPQQIAPANNVIELKNGAGCSIEFSVAVEDPDVDNVIRASFFIDFDRTVTNNPSVNRDIFPTSSATVRPTFARVTYTGSDPNINLFTVDTHTVDIFVTDTSLDEKREARPASTFADGGAVRDQGFTDSFTWYVNTVPGNCP